MDSKSNMINDTKKQSNGTSLLLETRVYGTVYNPETIYSQLSLSSRVEIGFVLSGSGVHRIVNQEIPCREGDIFIVNANIPHGYFTNEKGTSLEVRLVRFDPREWLEGEIASIDTPRFCYGVFHETTTTAYAMLNTKTQQEVHFLFEALEAELAEQTDEWENAVKAHLSLLLITVGRYINSAIKSTPAARPKDWALIASAIRTISKRYGENTLTLDSIAGDLFVSPSHLSRVFQQMMEISFSKYLRSVRIDNACRLLKDTEMTVEEIVAAIGLRDIPTFYHSFGVQVGMTPNQYRTEQKNKAIEELKGKRAMIILSEISAQLQAGKAKLVKEMVQQAIDEGIPAETILKEGLVAGMNVIGEKFKNNEVFVPEVLVAARAMNQGAALLKPLLVQEGVKSAGKVCIGTVLGDLHDIGKNIVKMMLEGKGFEVIDLGTDVPPEAFVNTAKEQGCQIICCSALLTTTMGVMADVVKAAEAAGIRDQVKIMVGGAPITEDFAREIGADAYTADAASCAELALTLVK